MGGVSAQCAHMTGRNWVFSLQLALLLSIQTMLHPHTVGQPRHLMCTLLVKYVLVRNIGH